jgi:hypothetical protein
MAPTLATSASLLSINLSPALRSNMCGVIEGTRQELPRNILYGGLLFVHDQILNQGQPFKLPEAVPLRYVHFMSLNHVFMLQLSSKP